MLIWLSKLPREVVLFFSLVLSSYEGHWVENGILRPDSIWRAFWHGPTYNSTIRTEMDSYYSPSWLTRVALAFQFTFV